MNKVVVTGANGYIGRILVKELVEREISVVAIDKSDDYMEFLRSNYVTCVVCDINKSEQITKAIPSGTYDAFYHLAWQGVNGPEKANPAIQLHNIEMLLECAAASKMIGCKKFLSAGTVAELAVYSLPFVDVISKAMTYGVAKHCAHLMLEAFCKSHDIRFVWMQFSNTYGPTNRTGNLVNYTINTLKQGLNPTFGPSSQMYDFIYDKDLVEAIIRLGKINNKKNCYYIGSGEPRMLSEYLNEIGRQCSATARIMIGERPDDGIKYTKEMFDNSDLVREIGDYVTFTFSDGIANTLESLKEEITK